MKFSRQFAMPNAETFSIPPISELLDRWLPMPLTTPIIVDPFARNSRRATVTNDLNPNTSAQFHLLAEDFVRNHVDNGTADAVLFDPPYSPVRLRNAINRWAELVQ